MKKTRCFVFFTEYLACIGEIYFCLRGKRRQLQEVKDSTETSNYEEKAVGIFLHETLKYIKHEALHFELNGCLHVLTMELPVRIWRLFKPIIFPRKILYLPTWLMRVAIMYQLLSYKYLF